MRKNCQQVVRAFDSGKALRPAASIHTDGETIYSYNTAILTRHPGGNGKVILNRTRYSTTTTIHQNAIAAAYQGVLLEVDGLPQGCSVATLLRYAGVPA